MLVKNHYCKATAAFFGALLSLAAPNAAAQADQITNIAQVEWDSPAGPRMVESNSVVIDKTDYSASIIPLVSDNVDGHSVSYIPSQCGQASSSTGTSAGDTTTSNMSQTTKVTAGQVLTFQITMSAANVDSGVIDSISANISSQSGDMERVRVFETGENTGVFIGQIQTIPTPPALVQYDCKLSLLDVDVVTVGVLNQNGNDLVATLDIDVLADPFGLVFDSETAEPVSGATVRFINADTGQPATVYAEDGVTPWPHTVVSGQPITDNAGNVYPMAPGAYWFPLAPLGSYRIEVTPPDPYTWISKVSPAGLAGLTRPGGLPFTIFDASYGKSFDLVDATAIRVDIPVDHPSLAVDLSKTASRTSVQPGDAILYTVTASNTLISRTKRDVQLVDTPSSWLRLRKESIRLNGAPAPDAIEVSPSNGQLTVKLGDLAPGQSKKLTYAMTIRSDAPIGQALNSVTVTDSLGQTSTTSIAVDVVRDTIAGRMTLMGSVTAGSCDANGDALRPIPGVQVMLEDGSFAVTDKEGRYHFEGLVPGTHVAQVAARTLPKGGRFIDCTSSTRSAGSAISRFITGQGGSLVVADFHAIVPAGSLPAAKSDADGKPVEGEAIEAAATIVARETIGNASNVDSDADEDADADEGAKEATSKAAPEATSEADPEAAPLVGSVEAQQIEAGGKTDWLALGDGEDGFLFPAMDHNPRVPSIRVAVRHRKGQTIKLHVDGKLVDDLAFDGARSSDSGKFAVSTWRGIPLDEKETTLRAEVINSMGGVSGNFERKVHFVATPARAQLIAEKSTLVADGVTRPVLAVRMLDRNNRPIHAGIGGEFTLNAPYQSASQIERQQLSQLSGVGGGAARWVVEGSDGIALIELAPTMVSGSVRLDFQFKLGDVTREQELEAWIEPGDIEWTVVGLIEGSVGEKTIATNMEVGDNFDSDLGENARVALYAKGRVLGKFLLTMAYDSAKQSDDQQLLGSIDPNSYYTVFADGSSRRFDAASREKLYVRIESSTFYALYGDFESGFDSTQLTRYNRTMTGGKAEARLGNVRAQGFAAKVGTRYRRDEMQGAGLSGPYALSDRDIMANSEKVRIETRDRQRPEIVVSTRDMTRFIDYDIDLLSGTITFSAPVASRDFDLNPQFIVVDYEVSQMGKGEWNGGVRTSWTSDDDRLTIGASAITDKGDEERTNIGGVDLRAKVGDNTEIRAEIAMSESGGDTAGGWLVEAQHQTGKLDLLAYARSLDAGFGTGQQSGAVQGRRKLGMDARLQLNQHMALVSSLWHDESLVDASKRQALQLQGVYQTGSSQINLGISSFRDTLNDGGKNSSTILEAGATQRLFDNKLELSAATSIALDQAESVDLPATHRIGARYSVASNVRLIGVYEVSKGENLTATTLRGGLEVTPWNGARATTTVGQQSIGEGGQRSFAAFGLAQSLAVTDNITVDATLDGNRSLNGSGSASDVINPAQPVTSGGHLGESGVLFEDFTAATIGMAFRKDRWSSTIRGEYRDGEFANRMGVTLGALRQMGEGGMVGSGFTWTHADTITGQSTEIMDGSIAFAHRPANSNLAMLGKLEYRSDKVVGAVEGEVGAAGNSALTVTGDAKSRRLIASLSSNWTPRSIDSDGTVNRRNVLGLFVAARHNLDQLDDFNLKGTSILVGMETHVGLSKHLDIGGIVNVRSNLTDNTTSYSFGPQLGISPTNDVLLTIGYNFHGFKDTDFARLRQTEKGLFASIRAKFDASTFDFLKRD